MTILAAIGLGYCARHLVAGPVPAFSSIIATARSPEAVAAMPNGLDGHVFDGARLSAALAAALARGRGAGGIGAAGCRRRPAAAARRRRPWSGFGR